MNLVLRDPDEHLEESPKIDIDLNVFFVSYYRSLLSLIESGNIDILERRYADRTFQSITLPRVDLPIGLDNHVQSLLSRFENLGSELVKYLISVSTTDTSPIEINGIPIEIGKDGIAVIPGSE